MSDRLETLRDYISYINEQVDKSNKLTVGYVINDISNFLKKYAEDNKKDLFSERTYNFSIFGQKQSEAIFVSDSTVV